MAATKLSVHNIGAGSTSTTGIALPTSTLEEDGQNENNFDSSEVVSISADLKNVSTM